MSNVLARSSWVLTEYVGGGLVVSSRHAARDKEDAHYVTSRQAAHARSY